jgi:four helix bundle protein
LVKEYNLTPLNYTQVPFAIVHAGKITNRKSLIVNRKVVGNLDKKQFAARTKQMALRVIKMVGTLPKGMTASVIGRQVLRSATSVGANYRAACRARSTADMIAKLKIVEEEADETLYWLELLVEADLVPEGRLVSLMEEVNEIVAMTVASIKTLRRRHINRQS